MALIQDNKPVAFARKTLTQTEANYVNIACEMLAVVLGFTNFHSYLFGHQFSVISDHKPLQAVHLKHHSDAQPRSRWRLLRLQQYDLPIRYSPGLIVQVADALSRLSGEDKDELDDGEVIVDEVIHQFTADLKERI